MTWRELLDRVEGKAPKGAKRSSRWPKVRRAYLDQKPSCECCRRWRKRHQLEVHHVIPFHLAPDAELDSSNLITLCRRCHLIIGHAGNWSNVNPNVVAQAFAISELRR